MTGLSPSESDAGARYITRRAPMPIRVLGLLGGVALLAVTAAVTLGLSALAALGIAVAAFLARRRGRALTRGRAWIVGAGTAAVGTIVGITFLILALPKADRATMWSAIEQSQKQDVAAPPPWLEQIAPESARKGAGRTSGDPVADRLARSKSFQVYFGILGGGLAMLLFGAVFGSLGWGGASLVRFGAAGAFFPPAPRRVLPGDERPSTTTG